MVTPMEEHNLRTVGEVADLVGVSVRTLHHWDDIGLVSPQWRSWADYRLYNEEDVAQIYQVLLYRETGMPLKTIRDMLESNSSPADHLQRQLELLQQRKHRVTSMIESVHQLLEDTMNHNEPLSADHTAKVLGREWSKWEKEAEERWGDTEDWGNLPTARSTAGQGRLCCSADGHAQARPAPCPSFRIGYGP
ncbi:transcriptional activator [Corynebacterium diphtheriae]|nr:transcriptional activator [Corynebacterium diphtheriae]